MLYDLDYIENLMDKFFKDLYDIIVNNYVSSFEITYIMRDYMCLNQYEQFRQCDRFSAVTVSNYYIDYSILFDPFNASSNQLVNNLYNKIISKYGYLNIVMNQFNIDIKNIEPPIIDLSKEILLLNFNLTQSKIKKISFNNISVDKYSFMSYYLFSLNISNEILRDIIMDEMSHLIDYIELHSSEIIISFK